MPIHLDDIRWHVGHVLRRLRQAHQLSQSALAEASGVAQSKIQRLEDRGVGSLDTVTTLAEVLGTTVGEATSYAERLNGARSGDQDAVDTLAALIRKETGPRKS